MIAPDIADKIQVELQDMSFFTKITGVYNTGETVEFVLGQVRGRVRENGDHYQFELLPADGTGVYRGIFTFSSDDPLWALKIGIALAAVRTYLS